MIEERPAPDRDDFAARLSRVGALADPVRRSLYGYVCSQPDSVSTDQAAAATGIARHNAKFHLDRLVNEGLLETEFRRLEGRGGPGAGRPTKFFRRAARELSVTLPERHYELAGELLATAVDDSVREGTSVLEELVRAAERTGLAAAEASGSADAGALDDAVTSVWRALAAHGYEPQHQDGTITLTNCPFHALAKTHTTLVCGMNLALIGAITERLGEGTLAARLDPDEHRCCVVVSYVE
jgi:predicted ArsR family transcriptional regulator